MFEDSRVHEMAGAWSTFEREVLPHAGRAMWIERNRADAEDAVQRPWCRHCDRFIDMSRERTAAAGQGTFHPGQRSRRSHCGTAPFVPPVPQDLTDELVLGCLRQLPPLFQEVILLCDVEDLSYKEAAEAIHHHRAAIGAAPPGTRGLDT